MSEDDRSEATAVEPDPVTAVEPDPVTVAEEGAEKTRKPLRGRRIAAVVLAVVVLAVATVVVLLYRANVAGRDVEAARVAAVEAAQQKVPVVLSYDHRMWDQNLATAKTALTGQFLQDFETLATQLVGPTAKAKSVVTTASVGAASVVRADAGRVVTLVFVNQQTHSSDLAGPQINSSRVRVTLDLVGDAWLISGMEPI